MQPNYFTYSFSDFPNKVSYSVRANLNCGSILSILGDDDGKGNHSAVVVFKEEKREVFFNGFSGLSDSIFILEKYIPGHQSFHMRYDDMIKLEHEVKRVYKALRFVDTTAMCDDTGLPAFLVDLLLIDTEDRKGSSDNVDAVTRREVLSGCGNLVSFLRNPQNITPVQRWDIYFVYPPKVVNITRVWEAKQRRHLATCVPGGKGLRRRT